MFKVGDVCEIVRCFTEPLLVGMECEVMTFHPDDGDGCIVAVLVNGYRSYHYTGQILVQPEQLRLKRPPNKDEFTAGEWELCPFNPYKKRETA